MKMCFLQCDVHLNFSVTEEIKRYFIMEISKNDVITLKLYFVFGRVLFLTVLFTYPYDFIVNLFARLLPIGQSIHHKIVHKALNTTNDDKNSEANHIIVWTLERNKFWLSIS